MTAVTSEPNDGRLASLKAAVQEAVDFASTWPGEFRPKVFDVALDQLIGGTTIVHPRPQIAGGTSVRAAPVVAAGLDGIAQELGVEFEALTRAVEIDEEGKVSILGRLDGRTRSDLQIRFSVVYCYVKEKALGQFNTPIEELRVLCQTHGCYDLKNFTSNFRGSADVLREIGNKGAHDRSYRLSPKGVETAKALLRTMAEA
jgi:hypothetical protein